MLKFHAWDDREEPTFGPEAEPAFAIRHVVGSDVDEAVEAFAVDQGLKFGADQDVGAGFASFGVALNADWVFGAGGRFVAEVCFEGKALGGASAGCGEVDGDERSVINLDADLFNGCDEDIAVAVFAENR